MRICDMYIVPLKNINEFITITELTDKVCEIFPDLFNNATKQIQKHKNPTTPFKAIRARIQSEISRGRYAETLIIDSSSKPIKIKYKG